ncbi:MAG: hypothetical protein NTY96_10705 [Bacteroidetes bacterium]|nr:hypothetical protein [Bacteroidota bacterium]
MSRKDQRYFEELKKKIVAMMQQSYPGINPSISKWKGQEITDFQEELLTSVNAHISEKWFYTHMKSVSKSLPRIDVLNLLSKYAGYANWDDFVFKNQDLIQASSESILTKAANPGTGNEHPNRYFIFVPLAVLFIVLIFAGVFKLFNAREYRFCFYDADTREPITNSKIEVKILLEGESPVTSYCSSNGCFLLKTDKSLVKMVVSAPYYQTDTIRRVVKKLQPNEIISLHANDYALMIHYFSQMKVADWGKRRARLENMIDEGAMIYEVYSEKNAASGMELLNKQEFIDKLTMPSGSLKNIEILDTKFRDGKIIVLRFRVKLPS